MRRNVLELSDAFAQVVAKRRKAKGFSKAGLAERAGLHQTYIGLLERGERSPNLDTANAIAAALGISLAQMINGQSGFRKNTRRFQRLLFLLAIGSFAMLSASGTFQKISGRLD